MISSGDTTYISGENYVSRGAVTQSEGTTYIEAEKDISLPYMGSKNQRVIDIKWSLGYKEPTLWWTQEEKGK